MATPPASLDVPALIARLATLRAEVPDGVLAFDADGTLWTGDVTRDLVSFLMSERPLRPDGLARLRAIAVEAGVATADDVYDQVALLVLAYSARQIPDAVAVESVLVAFAGHAPDRFLDLATRAIDGARLDARFRPALSGIFDWAHVRGVPLIVVSASPRVVVEEALSRLSLRATAVLGAELAVEAGVHVSSLAVPVLAGEAKVHALHRHTRAPVLAAFGDDVRDLPLLAEARLAVGVGPTAELLDRGVELPDFRVLSLP